MISPRLSSPARVLVTGGAGYIGSHTVLALQAAGWDVAVADNLSTGHRRLVPDGVALHVGDVGDAGFIAPLLAEFQPAAVIHFAASVSVPESVTDPALYYRNNFAVTCTLVEACVNANVPRFIFSSTASVYGATGEAPVTEDTPAEPINPYGASKLMAEQMLRDTAAASGLRYVILRYFNVGGADPAGRSGLIADASTNLIKVVSELAAGRRKGMTVHGNDYTTPDGTCVRDYIHVSDVADAHAAALDYLMNGGESDVMNCGYGRGYSVLDVIAAAGRVTGRRLAYDVGERRAGDPGALVADCARLARLGWSPRHADLNLILRTAIAWESTLN